MKKIKLLLALFILLPATAYAYTVKSGDTFCGIARNFDIPCSELKQDNQNINDYNKIYPGDIVDVSHETMLGGTVSKPYTFSPNTVIRSSEINNNFDTLYTLVNGNIDNNNISASAAIGPTKINGTAIVATPSSAQTITGTTTISGQFVVDTTTGYLRVPKMTQTQRLALTPDQGALVYDTTNGQFYAYEGSTWAAISPAGETATANTSTKGIVQEATLADQLAGTATGSTGARLYMNPTNTATSSAGVADAGKLVKLRASDGYIDSSFGGAAGGIAQLDSSQLVVQNPANATSTPTANKIPIADSNGELKGWGNKFGGNGTDGALSLSAGTTTINLGGAKLVEKNYTSISITTGTLTFSNPHPNGTIVILKSQGNVTITCATAPCIDLRGIGAAAGTATGTAGSIGNGIWTVGSAHYGGAHSGSTGGTGGVIIPSSTPYLVDVFGLNSAGKFLAVGSGGSAGVGTGFGNGGRGGGSILIEVGGYLNFTTSNGINCSGSDGSSATALASAGGGGGGSAGMCSVIYNKLTSSSGTIYSVGGNGGASTGDISGGSCSGGAGAGSIYGAGGNGGNDSTAGSNGGGLGAGAGGGACKASSGTSGGNGGGSLGGFIGLNTVWY